MNERIIRDPDNNDGDEPVLEITREEALRILLASEKGKALLREYYKTLDPDLIIARADQENFQAFQHHVRQGMKRRERERLQNTGNKEGN